MDRLTEQKIVLITRRTRLDDLVARFNTIEQARFYVEHLGADFSDYQREDARYKTSVKEARLILSRMGRLQTVDRSFLPNFIFGHQDTVVVLGQDGLVANVLKYLTTQPVVGVNPDPERWEGVLLPFKVTDLQEVIAELFAGTSGVKLVTMAKAQLNTGLCLYGVNDLFIGPKSHTSARYTITVGDQSEYHSSSGIIASTGLGSTGWLRSIYAGALGIAEAVTNERLGENRSSNFDWDADFLVFSVREPWPSRKSTAGITFGKVTAQQPLKLVSHMPENGVIFSDGMENDFLEFNSGAEAAITVAEKKGHLVV